MMKLPIWFNLFALQLIHTAVIPTSYQYRLDIIRMEKGTQKLCLSVGTCHYTCVLDFYDETSTTVPKYQSQLCPNIDDYMMTLICASRENPNVPSYLVNPHSTNIPCQYGGSDNGAHSYYHCPPKDAYSSRSTENEIGTKSIQQVITTADTEHYSIFGFRVPNVLYSFRKLYISQTYYFNKDTELFLETS
ncbi:hypothetical protein BD560DRAFT_387130 [Blakeslea trispora]|nr:hypothetical protein BD560DRAFT_387130 [Blakeslea trispora]